MSTMAEEAFAIEYVYVPEMAERRGPVREEHLAFLRGGAADGWLALAGALTDPIDGAWFVVRADGEAAAWERMQADPYVRAGLVRSIRVRGITLVVPS